MVAVVVGKFHARDAEGRVYMVHELQESGVDATGSSVHQPSITYQLAIGDRVTRLESGEFQLVQTGVKITREPEYVPPVV